jgi:transcriptional regulator with XRE-family HTH domain
LRSKHGWTQEQFAEFCGLHRTYMGHVERGEKNVSLSTVARVANALGVRIAALFGSSQQPLSHGATPPRARKANPATAVRAARTDVNRLLEELQAQRQAMRQSLRELANCVVRLSETIS